MKKRVRPKPWKRILPGALGILVALSLRGQTISEFPPPGTNPGCLSFGATGDDHLWSAYRGQNADGSGVARIATDGTIVFYPLKGASVPPNIFLRLQCITAGPPDDGAVWFTLTETGFGQIGRITPDGAPTVFPNVISSRVDGIAAGPDGAIWFTEGSAAKIARITTDGTITNEYPVITAGSYPDAIVQGPGGSNADLWFTERDGGGKIGRITISGLVSEYTIPTADSSPQSITLGPDGNLWFTETRANQIGKITTSGSVIEFTVPTPNGAPQVIANGPDGALWFTENGGNKLGRITTDGHITELNVPTSEFPGPFGIATGPDGNVWFSESGSGKIGRVNLAVPACGVGRGHVRPAAPASGLPCVTNRS